MRVDGVSQSISVYEIFKLSPQTQNNQSASTQLDELNNKAKELNLSSQKQNTDMMDEDILKDPEELKRLMKELQSKLSYLNSQLKIEIDREIEQPVVKIMDINTNQVIRQIPPDYMIN
ncbi:MAG: flagellar protein FlaG, partial [Thermoplasmata archaeon]